MSRDFLNGLSMFERFEFNEESKSHGFFGGEVMTDDVFDDLPMARLRRNGLTMRISMKSMKQP